MDSRVTQVARPGEFSYKPELDRVEAITRQVLDEIGPARPPRKAEGHGRKAQKLARMIAQALQRDFDLEINPQDLTFWVQPPAYRGPRWDLAVWGASCRHPLYPKQSLTFHSWSTMTALAKGKALSLSQEHTRSSFNVELL
jgi:hypothetical protein